MNVIFGIGRLAFFSNKRFENWICFLSRSKVQLSWARWEEPNFFSYMHVMTEADSTSELLRLKKLKTMDSVCSSNHIRICYKASETFNLLQNMSYGPSDDKGTWMGSFWRSLPCFPRTTYKINFNTTPPSPSRSSWRSLSTGFQNQICIRVFLNLCIFHWLAVTSI
jgi:hypothetical protein